MTSIKKQRLSTGLSVAVATALHLHAAHFYNHFLCLWNGGIEWGSFVIDTDIALSYWHRWSSAMKDLGPVSLMIVSKFCTWHNSCAVVAWAKFCCDLMGSKGIIAKRCFHRAWMPGENRWWNGSRFSDVNMKLNMELYRRLCASYYVRGLWVVVLCTGRKLGLIFDYSSYKLSFFKQFMRISNKIVKVLSYLNIEWTVQSA